MGVPSAVAIIGSGPTGVAAAKALVARGVAVVIYDGGEDVDSRTRAEQELLANLIRSGGDPRPVNLPSYGGTETPLKLFFGSNFAQRPHPSFPIGKTHSTDMSPSFAVGGLSNVWGASSLKFRLEDLTHWPISYDVLDESYAEVLSWFSTTQFGPNQLLNRANDRGTEWQIIDPIFRDLIERLRGRPGHGQHYVVGPSNLAMTPKLEDCHSCGRCLSGCPFDYIFSARTELSGWKSDSITRRSGEVVIGLNETEHGVLVTSQNREGTIRTDEHERVLVAAGPIQSSALALAALGVNEPAVLADCQAFTVPMLSPRASLRDGRQISLAHGIIELLDYQSRKSDVYFQMYPPGWEIRQAVASISSRLRIPEILLHLIQPRSLAAHGFLPSHQSHSLLLNVKVSPNGLIAKVDIGSRNNPVTTGLVKRASSRLRRLMAREGVVVLTPMVHVELPGRGYHIGCSFPMSRTGEHLTSDLFGRPSGLQRIHIVDASVLPDLPPQSPTLTAMANATRIAAAIALDTVD